MSYEFHFPLGSDNTRCRFLLKAMKHVDETRQLDSIDRSVSIALYIGNDLENACATEALEWLRARML